MHLTKYSDRVMRRLRDSSYAINNNNGWQILNKMALKEFENRQWITSTRLEFFKKFYYL